MVLCLINYPVYLISKYFIYIEGARYVCSQVWKGVVHVWWGLCHASDHMKYILILVFVPIKNGFSSLKSKIQNSFKKTYVHFNNVTIPTMTGHPIRLQGDNNYVEPIIYEPTQYARPMIRKWKQKNFDRFFSDKAIKEKQLTMTIYCINCIIEYHISLYQDKLTKNSTTKTKFWSKRYKRITNDIEIYKNIPMIEFRNNLSNDNFLPSVEHNKIQYENIKQEFKNYICNLKNLKKSIYKKNYDELDNYIKKIQTLV